MNLGAKLGNQFERTERVIGTEKVESLHNKCVAVFGVGGVGGYVCEALARAGVGKLVIVDADEVDITNINRQIIALHSTIGRKKTEVMKERLLDINPKMEVVEHAFFFLPETSDKIDFSGVDYICDAVDTVTAKMETIKVSKEKNNKKFKNKKNTKKAVKNTANQQVDKHSRKFIKTFLILVFLLESLLLFAFL